MGALCAQRKMLAMRVSVFGQQVAVRAAPSAVVRRARSPRVPAPPPSTSIEETPMGGERESRAGAGAGVEVARARAHASARATLIFVVHWTGVAELLHRRSSR